MPSERLAVDAHVHLYEPALFDRALTAAAANLRTAVPGASTGMLLLTESHGHHAHATLAQQGAERLADGSLRITIDGFPLILVPGFQANSAEGLEVLAIGTETRPADCMPVTETIAAIHASGGLPVLPWGVGKWTGARRGAMHALLRQAEPGRLFLGDNGGRPGWWREPLFRHAAARGIRLLPGTDPLPIANAWRGIGTIGFTIDLSAGERPADALKRTLRDPAVPVHPFGQPASTLAFARDQLALRLRRVA